MRDGCQVAFGDGVPSGAWGWVPSSVWGWVPSGAWGWVLRGVWVGADRRLEQLLEGGGGDLSERCVNDTANPGLGGCAHSVI